MVSGLPSDTSHDTSRGCRERCAAVSPLIRWVQLAGNQPVATGYCQRRRSGGVRHPDAARTRRHRIPVHERADRHDLHHPGRCAEHPAGCAPIGLWDKGVPIAGAAQQPITEGTTLLAGHVNDAAQGNGTLHDLYKVEPGALVYVVDQTGAITRWRVVGLDLVVKAALT